MTIDQLRSVVRSRPFRPFIIRTADSREVPVNHPENIAFGGGRTAFVVRPNDRVEIIDLLLVVSLEFADSAETGNPPHEESLPA